MTFTIGQLVKTTSGLDGAIGTIARIERIEPAFDPKLRYLMLKTIDNGSRFMTYSDWVTPLTPLEELALINRD